MFEEGKLLRFEPFIFKNGASPKPKYLLVLKVMDHQLLLASLPTSKDHIPSDIPVQTGCVKDEARQISAFVFRAADIVVKKNDIQNSFQFPLNTFVYCSDIDSYPEEGFKDQQSEGKTVITDLGFIKAELFKSVLDCLRNSLMVKRKYKRLLS